MFIATAVQQLLAHINRAVTLSPPAIAALSNIVIPMSLAKKELLLKPSQTSKHMNFIVGGVMRSYYVDENLQEHTLQLGVEEWWINDLQSYLSATPSTLFIQALEDATILRLPKNELDRIMQQHPEISEFFRLKIQAAYVALQERLMLKMTANVFDRYNSFRATYRHIEQRVPQYVVASYLGVTPEFLSTVRKKYASRNK